jgi:flagellar basal-body rod protein FlgC
MSSVLSIATSGMQAASTRLEVAASNTANILTTGPLPASTASGTSAASTSASTSGFPQAYVPLTVVQSDASSGSGVQGTVANVVPVSPATVATPDPGAPYADQNGLVAAPNLDPVDLMVQTAIAKYAFSANAAVAKAGSDMTKSLLNILT